MINGGAHSAQRSAAPRCSSLQAYVRDADLFKDHYQVLEAN
jgi:hypothetical protein